MTHAPPPLVDDAGAPLVLLGRAPLRGGEASVYEAEDADGRRVAVKVAHLPGAAWLGEERALLAALGEDPATSELVARVRGGGVWGERPFLVLDWYPATLERWVAAEPPWERRMAMAARLAEAVAGLHRARPTLVHRDLKPSNVLLDGEERVVLADFGASRVAPPGDTMTLRALHTPGYGPPEASLPGPQRASQEADVYALAATLFHVVVGRPPAAPRRNAQRLTPDGERLLLGIVDRADADTDRWLDYDRMTALDPRDRRDLAATIGRGRAYAALLDALEPRPSRRRTRAQDLAAAFGDVDALARARRAERRTRRAWGLAVVALVVSVAGVAVGAGIAARGARTPIGPAMVSLPAGEFLDPATGAIARVERPFRIGAYEVTQAEWRAVTGVDPASLRQNVGGYAGAYCTEDHLGRSFVGDDLPVVCVSWFDAVAFANTLSEREGLAPAYTITLPAGTHAPIVEEVPGAEGYRLPTAAEWTRAATIGTFAPRPAHFELGHCMLGNLADIASGAMTASWCDDGFPLLAPVGSFPASPSGVFDLHGNVAEWLAEAGADEGTRGHAGLNFGSGLRGAPSGWYRGHAEAAMRSVGTGLRLARSGP